MGIATKTEAEVKDLSADSKRKMLGALVRNMRETEIAEVIADELLTYEARKVARLLYEKTGPPDAPF